MTLAEFSNDLVSLIQLIISCLVVASIILLWDQIRLTNIWNKANTQHLFLADLPSEDLERRFLNIYESKE